MCIRASLRGVGFIVVIGKHNDCFPRFSHYRNVPRASLQIDHNSSHTALKGMNKLLTLPRSPAAAAVKRTA